MTRDAISKILNTKKLKIRVSVDSIQTRINNNHLKFESPFEAAGKETSERRYYGCK